MKKWWQRRKQTARSQSGRDVLCRLTVSEWRANPGWVAQAASVLHEQRVQQMLDAVSNSTPFNEVLPLSASWMDRATQQARQEGYTMALANLMALGTAQALPEAVEAVFEDMQRQTGGA